MKGRPRSVDYEKFRRIAVHTGSLSETAKKMKISRQLASHIAKTIGLRYKLTQEASEAVSS